MVSGDYKITRRGFVASTFAALAGGCSQRQSANRAANSHKTATIEFEDVTGQAGINWVHNPCLSGKKYLPETVGGGGGFLDFDNDGLLDILLINGAPLPGYKGPTPQLALYHNNGNGTFTEVSKEVGLHLTEYGYGAAVGDFNNDGWPDIYITTLNGNRLFRNDHGKFVDVTRESGTAVARFTTSAMWLDYNGDGLLDLYVGNYVHWSPAIDLPCGPNETRQYCPPYQFQGAPPILFRNCGDGTFEDVSYKTGVLGHSSKSLGLALYDFDGDGLADMYVANDTEPDLLLMNRAHATFEDMALQAGTALGADGSATGSMGVDVATPFNDGRAAIIVGTFAGQEASLFVSRVDTTKIPGVPLFQNLNQQCGVAQPTRDRTTFGAAFADFDLDGWQDILLLNGHIDNDPSLIINGAVVPYAQPPSLFQNLHNGSFTEATEASGLNVPMIGRGLAIGDYNNDGLIDLLTFDNRGAVRLWRNKTSTINGGWLGVMLRGVKSPADGVGALVSVVSELGTQRKMVASTRSYLSCSDMRVHFGTGGKPVALLQVRWPSGMVTQMNNPPANRYLTITEPHK